MIKICLFFLILLWKEEGTITFPKTSFGTWAATRRRLFTLALVRLWFEFFFPLNLWLSIFLVEMLPNLGRFCPDHFFLIFDGNLCKSIFFLDFDNPTFLSLILNCTCYCKFSRTGFENLLVNAMQLFFIYPTYE